MNPLGATRKCVRASTRSRSRRPETDGRPGCEPRLKRRKFARTEGHVKEAAGGERKKLEAEAPADAEPTFQTCRPAGTWPLAKESRTGNRPDSCPGRRLEPVLEAEQRCSGEGTGKGEMRCEPNGSPNGADRGRKASAGTGWGPAEAAMPKRGPDRDCDGGRKALEHPDPPSATTAAFKVCRRSAGKWGPVATPAPITF